MSQFQKFKPTKYLERAKKDISSGKKERNQRTSGNAWIVEKQKIFQKSKYHYPSNQSCIARSEKSKILRATFHKYRPSGGTSQKIDFVHILLIGSP